jgi:phosphatidyl-myo-inositol dimannoside synthase
MLALGDTGSFRFALERRSPMGAASDADAESAVRPDRVVFVTTDFRPSTGGIADYLHRLADSLTVRLPVTVMSTVPSRGATWPHRYQLAELPALPVRRLGSRIGDGIAPARKLHTGRYFAALRRFGNDVVARVAPRSDEKVAVLIGLWDTASHFWCAAAHRANLPYQLFAHGAEIVNPLYGGLPGWRRVDFGAAAGVIGCSRATAALVAEQFCLSRPPVVVNPSVGPRPASAGETSAAEFRRHIGIGDGPVLLSVGRLVARKGFDLALRSVAELRDEIPGLTYVLAGDGPERSSLEASSRELNISSRVRFLGAVDDDTKWAAYDACDVFVMPNRVLGGSDFEGFGIVFLEAGFSQRAVIGGRNGGTADAIVDELTGLLVDPEEPGALTRAIRRLACDGALRDRLGRAGALRARDVHNADAAGAALWRHLIGEDASDDDGR